MSLGPEAIRLVDMQVSYFMDIRNQKLKSMKVFINSDSWYVSMLARKIA
jgi:hypothetical protein